jgi:hypothetical protein
MIPDSVRETIDRLIEADNMDILEFGYPKPVEQALIAINEHARACLDSLPQMPQPDWSQAPEWATHARLMSGKMETVDGSRVTHIYQWLWMDDGAAQATVFTLHNHQWGLSDVIRETVEDMPLHKRPQQGQEE